MTPDEEQAIREVIASWMRASTAGDVDTVLGLMADDVVFMTPGREPFGKEAFAAASSGMRGMKLEGVSEPVEIEVAGDWAYARSRITVTVTPPRGEPRTRSGYALSIFRRERDGSWVLSRDANLLT